MKKEALGVKGTLAVGATLAGGAHLLGKATNKAQEYKAGFQPGGGMNHDIMQKVAEVAPQHYDFLVKHASEVKESPFREEILDEMDTLIKSAFDWKGMGNAAARGAGAAGGAIGAAAVSGIAMALAGDMYEAARRGLTKTRNYKQMMSANPDLRDLPAKDVQKAFSVLHRFNPEFASDPSVSGAWVKRQASFGDDAFGNVTELKGLIDSRKSLADTKKLPTGPKLDLHGHGGKSEGKEQKGPGKDTEMHQKMDALQRMLSEQDQAGQGMFNDQSQFFAGQFGGQRTTPPKK